MAEVLFDLSEEVGASSVSSKRGMQAIVRGTEQMNLKQSERSKIMFHIGQAIDAQTKNQEDHAADELEKALETVSQTQRFILILDFLRSKAERMESAIPHLQIAVKHKDYALGSRLLMAQIQRHLGHLPEAAVEYLEALKIADSLVVPPDQSAEIRQLYEPLIESQNQQTDTEKMEQLCDNINHLLLRPNWRSEVTQAREQLPKSAEGIMPLAEILTQAQSGQVIEAVGKVRQFARCRILAFGNGRSF